MKLFALAVGLLLATSALAQDATEPGLIPLPPQQELRAQRLGKELRCPVCQGMSIADSPSSMARAQLDKVRDLVQQGKTDQEIRDYFVARYGQWILLEPATNGFAGLVWLLPVLMLLGGAGLIFRVMKRPASPPPEAQAPAPTTDSDDPYLKAVRAELER
jgi:cytochrome c-type biogenesis protein CcmH